MSRRGADHWWNRLEALLWIGGTGLLLTFLVFRIAQAELQQAGVEAFADAQRSHAPVTGGPQPLAADLLSLLSPDQSLWSEPRIKAFEESKLLAAEIPLGVLSIERLRIEVPVYDDASELNLNRGVARIRGTAPFHRPGNLGIAGHRDGFFRPLKDIVAGDIIVLRTQRGIRHYRVETTTIVDPSDISVLSPTDEATLTLVTCYPFYFVGHAPKRFIVRARAEQSLALNQVRAI